MEVFPDGNVIVTALGLNKVVYVDTKTGKYTEHLPTGTGGPRRGEVDPQGRAWFALFNSGKVGMFDPRTKEIKEWPLPNPTWGGAPDPYAVALDKNGDVWAGGVSSDYVVRLNPATGRTTKYLVPTVNANFRRMNVDRSGKPVVWIGENHHSKIIKVEPLD
jgi:virginiamycin B lyase